MKLKRNYIFILAGLLMLLGGACDRRDLNELYKMAAENEIMVKHLEETAIDLNKEIANLYDLTQALMKRLHITDRQETPEGYRITFSDTIQVFIQQGRSAVVEIDPETKNWKINGEDTGISAEGKDGEVPANPQVRIDPETKCWEYSPDGQVWIKTSVKATGDKGESGDIPEVSINDAGNWTIGGMETIPAIPAVGKDGENAQVPMLGIRKDVDPPVWQISLDGGLTWSQTNVPALGENGADGTDGADASPYVESVMVVGDTMIFTFNADIPGIVPTTRQQKVVIEDGKISITWSSTELENVGGTNWLLFGVSETHEVTYSLSGKGIVHVDATQVPDGFEVAIDREAKRVAITSVSQSAHSIDPRGDIVLTALTSDGRTTECVIPVSLVFLVPRNNFLESYIYEILTTSGQRIAYQYVTYSNYRTRATLINSFYYGGIFDYSGNCPVNEPYETTLEPCVMTDIDGNRYKVCLLLYRSQAGNYIVLWTAENLRTEHYNDGTAIPNLKDPEAWKNDRLGAYCYYDNNKELYAKTQGALYNGYAVASGKLAPLGWEIPDESDWLAMEEFIVKESRLSVLPDELTVNGWRGAGAGIGNLVKSAFGWTTATGKDRYNWQALPDGKRNTDGSFSDKGRSGYWWSATDEGVGMFYRKMTDGYNGIYRHQDLGKSTGLSIRCIKILH